MLIKIVVQLRCRHGSLIPEERGLGGSGGACTPREKVPEYEIPIPIFFFFLVGISASGCATRVPAAPAIRPLSRRAGARVQCAGFRTILFIPHNNALSESLFLVLSHNVQQRIE